MPNLKVHIDRYKSNLPNATRHCHLLLRFHAARRDAPQRHRLRRRQNETHSDGI